MAIPQSIDDRTRDALSREQTVIDMTTTGRKSGKPRRIEIVLHNIDGRLNNLASKPQFTVHLKRGVKADLPATAREITDPKERRTVLEGVAKHWKRDDVDTMVQYSPLIEVSLG